MPKYKKITKVKFVCDLKHHEWWKVIVNKKWLLSVKDLNLGVEFVYSFCGKDAFGKKLEPWKKY